MANNILPKHDFAPAWLKIPKDAQKPCSGGFGDQHERPSRRDDLRTSGHDLLLSRQRQSSCDQGLSRRGSGRPYPHQPPHRHHSIDVDEAQYLSSGGSQSGLKDNCGSSGRRQFGSQPSLSRRHAGRQDNYNNYSSVYKGCGKLYGNSSDDHWNSSQGWKQGRQRSVNGSSSGKKEDAGIAKDPQEEKECSVDRFNQEFPSLRGDLNESNGTSTTSVKGGVWDHPRTLKVLGLNSNRKVSLTDKLMNIDNGDKRSDSPGAVNGGGAASPKPISGIHVHPGIVNASKIGSQATNSIYRSLIPAKVPGSLTRKSSKESFKINGLTANAKISNSRQASPTPPPLEMLNARLVTHPKNLGNKSDFLKTLRVESGKEKDAVPRSPGRADEQNEAEDKTQDDRRNDFNGKINSDTDEDVQEVSVARENGGPNFRNSGEKDEKQKGNRDDGCHEMNGVNIVTQSMCREKESPLMSGSLEDEKRLLKEMGWKEEGSGDEELYAPLTEDELKEFERNKSKMLHQQQKNGLKKSLHGLKSPKRWLSPYIKNFALHDNSGLTSSDSD